MTQQESSVTKRAKNQVLERQSYGSFEFIRCRNKTTTNAREERHDFGHKSLKLTSALQFVSQSFENDSKRDLGLLFENSSLVQMSWPPTSIENKSLESKNSRRNLLREETRHNLTLLERAAEVVPCLGIILSLGASIFLGTAGMLVKMTSSVHGIQVAVFRAIIQLFVYGLIIKLKSSPYLPEAQEFMPVMCRAFLGASSITFSYCALKLIPLGDATTIRFSLPIWTLMISFLVLNESCSFYKLFAVVLSISGVLLIAKPDDCAYLFNGIIHGFKFDYMEENTSEQLTIVGQETMNNNSGSSSSSDDKESNSVTPTNQQFRQLEGSLLALASSVCLSISLVALRLCKYTPAEVTILWLSIISIVIGSLSLIILQEWRVPNNRVDLLYIFLNGICGSIGQWFITSALKVEQSGVISLARTFDIEVAFLYSAFILHENIRMTSIIGSVLVSCGVLTVVVPKWLKSRRETSRNNHHPPEYDDNNFENCRNTIYQHPQCRTIQFAS